MGGMEILAVCAILGGIFGYVFRNKQKKNGAAIGIVLGVLGALVMTWLLVTYIFASYLAMPLYAILGAWLFNFLAAKIKK